MKVSITCPKCGSPRISITSNAEDPTPMYKCNKCGYKNRLFPQLWDKKEEIKDIGEAEED